MGAKHALCLNRGIPKQKIFLIILFNCILYVQRKPIQSIYEICCGSSKSNLLRLVKQKNKFIRDMMRRDLTSTIALTIA